jgi:2,4-dienoyl-CoA reductase-like NADH-dependent reductase (Old Yellow Enzyme family)
MPAPAPATQRATTLTDPLQLGRGGVIANRLARSALSEGLADRASNPTPQLIELYRRWAVTGSHGLIITGNSMVDRRQLAEPGNLVIEDDRALGGLVEWAAAARSGGAQVWMQINHPGRQALPMLTGNRPVGPSAVRPPIPGALTPVALTSDDITDLVERYATAARVAQRAGFDGVQFHGAHGYLISQFLSPLSNVRDDDWGGDPERRMRFILEILGAARAKVGPQFPLGIKLNSADFMRGGLNEEESMGIVDALAHAGIDLVEVSGGTYGLPAMLGQGVAESTRQREAYFQDYAEEVRRRTPGVPLMLTGGFRTTAVMQDALASGACDLVGIGRAPCVSPGVGAEILDGTRAYAPVGDRRMGARWIAGKVADVRQLDGAIDLQWHADQMHRMANGHDPDLSRAWYRSFGRMIRRNGWAALRRRRG